MVSAHARRVKDIVAQSRDRASVLRNLGILRMRNAISRLRKFSDCPEHMLRNSCLFMQKPKGQKLLYKKCMVLFIFQTLNLVSV